MNAYKANLLNSLALIIIGFWGYFESSSVTALIPVVFGFVLLACSKGVKNQNKIMQNLQQNKNIEPTSTPFRSSRQENRKCQQTSSTPDPKLFCKYTFVK